MKDGMIPDLMKGIPQDDVRSHRDCQRGQLDAFEGSWRH